MWFVGVPLTLRDDNGTRRSRPPSRAALGEWRVPSGPIAVGSPTLFRSNPQSTGDRYEVIDRQPGPR